MDNSAIYKYYFSELIGAMRHQREFYYRSSEDRTNENDLIFDIASPVFDDYQQIVGHFSSWVNCTLINMLRTIFDQNNISYAFADGCDFVLTINNRRIGVVIKADGYGYNIRKTMELYSDDRPADEIKVVFTFNRNRNTERYLNHLNADSSDLCAGYLRFEFLETFFASLFGLSEYAKFCEYADQFNKDVKEVVAYSTVIVPTYQEVQRYKVKVEETLRNFPYNQMLTGDIPESERAILETNYYDKKRYAALLGDADYADSFISSEWRYSVNQAMGVLDQTSIIAGYLKSIEQLLYALELLFINRGKVIQDVNRVPMPFDDNHLNDMNKALGALKWVLKHNDGLLDVNDGTKRYMIATLSKWTSNIRNGYFHKDNIHDVSILDEIRKQTILLYYLLLGGFSINTADYGKIGILDEGVKEIDEDILYRNIIKWATPIFLYRIPRETGAIGLVIRNLNKRTAQLTVQALEEDGAADYKWNYKQKYSTSNMSNDYSWSTSMNEKEIADLLARIVERFAQEATPAADKMRAIGTVKVGGVELYHSICL